MAKRGRKSRIKDNKKYVKEFCLLNLFDEESQCKVSDREFLRTKSHLITIDNKPIFTGIWTFLSKHPDIINSEPMKGCRINEKTVYDYNVKIGRIDSDRVSYDKFTKNTMKIKNKLDEKVKMKMICDELDYPTIAINESVFSYQKIISALIYIHGEKKYKKVEKEVEKRMLRR